MTLKVFLVKIYAIFLAAVSLFTIYEIAHLKISKDNQTNERVIDKFIIPSENNIRENKTALVSDSKCFTSQVTNNNRLEKNNINDFQNNYLSIKPNIEPNPYENNEFIADIKEGSIGKGIDGKDDNPYDNLFIVNIPNIIDLSSSNYYLEYEVLGVENADMLSKSINQCLSQGGTLEPIISNTWTKIKENVNPNILKTGNNAIRFSPKESLTYRIKNLKVKRIKTLQKDPIILHQNELFCTEDGVIYLSGYVMNYSHVLIGDTSIDVLPSEFELIYRMNDIELQNKKIQIQITKEEENLYSRYFDVIPSKEYKIKSKRKEKNFVQKTLISSETNQLITSDKAAILIPLNAVDTDVELSIQSISGEDIPMLPPGMINVTSDQKAYRFLPDGIKFLKMVDIQIPYDTALIPFGYSINDIKSYYFDIEKRTWQAIQKDSVNFINNTIVSKTNHFTDYINGIIQVPEAPGTSAFTPTMMSEIKVAEPASGLNIIQAPTVSQKGDANISFPIQIPTGRQGLQPSLGLTYSSGGASSWIGFGWDLQIPAITIDTRWGSPMYNADYETEVYSLNGEQLIYQDKYLPNRHREGSTYDTEFKKRNLGSTPFFEKKIRQLFED